jgi:hypothetical protein
MFVLQITCSVPTPQLSSGSTPTVSKDVTGPPTVVGDRSQASDLKTYTSTECEPIYAGTPVVCVYVCTDIVSVFDGEELVSETASSYETDCPTE